MGLRREDMVHLISTRMKGRAYLRFSDIEEWPEMKSFRKSYKKGLRYSHSSDLLGDITYDISYNSDASVLVLEEDRMLLVSPLAQKCPKCCFNLPIHSYSKYNVPLGYYYGKHQGQDSCDFKKVEDLFVHIFAINFANEQGKHESV